MTDTEIKKMYEGKRLFVDKFVKPMLVAMHIGVKDVKYVNSEYGEHVYVVYAGDPDYELKAYVGGDNYRGILIDLIKQNAI